MFYEIKFDNSIVSNDNKYNYTIIDAKTKKIKFIGKYRNHAPSYGKIFVGNKYYEGEILNGKANGKGIVKYNNEHTSNIIYEGEFKNGLYHGVGHIKNKYYEYIGEFMNGKKNGKGKYKTYNGLYYEGGYYDDLYHGCGILQKKNVIYEGEFHHGKFQGKGKFISKNEYYEGDFYENFYNGYGKLVVYKNFHNEIESIYEGMFIDGYYQGYGKYATENSLYEGNFNLGVYDGKGIIKYNENNVSCSVNFINGKKNGFATIYMNDIFKNKKTLIKMEGYFENDLPIKNFKIFKNNALKYVGQINEKFLPEGRGIYYKKNLLNISGTFHNGYLEGYGIMKYEDEIIYIGDFYKNKFFGEGILYKIDGIYECEFYNGLMNGYGVVKYYNGNINKYYFVNDKQL